MELNSEIALSRGLANNVVTISNNVTLDWTPGLSIPVAVTGVWFRGEMQHID
jgi:hypothetical protein